MTEDRQNVTGKVKGQSIDSKKGPTLRDRLAAETSADFAIDLGVIRADQRDRYIAGWLNRKFYDA